MGCYTSYGVLLIAPTNLLYKASIKDKAKSYIKSWAFHNCKTEIVFSSLRIFLISQIEIL
jgi:hypothetical protein